MKVVFVAFYLYRITGFHNLLKFFLYKYFKYSKWFVLYCDSEMSYKDLKEINILFDYKTSNLCIITYLTLDHLEYLKY